jgi:hypothetical protein
MTKRKPLGEFVQRALGLGRSQAALARELGVSRSTVHLWASGKREAPERFRDALRAAARPGAAVTPPPAPVTRSGARARTAGSAVVTPLPGGNVHIQTHARSAFARELGRLQGTKNAPSSFTVQLHHFRAEDSPPTAPTRTRRISVDRLTDAEIRTLASGSKDALEQVVSRAIGARNYSGGFTFNRATRFSFDSTP